MIVRLSNMVLVALLFTGLSGVAVGSEAKKDIPGWEERLRGIKIAFPETEWKLEYEETDKRQSIRATCVSDDCARSQRTCFFSVPNRYMDNRFMHNVAMMPFTLGIVKRRNRILKRSGDQATMTRDMHFEDIGGQVWWSGESLAPYRYKSVMEARTVIDGRFILFRCLTCERDENKFNFARDLMKTVKLGASGKLAKRGNPQD